MTNIELATKVITQLLKTGVTEFVLCAGARNSPFVEVLDANKHLKVYRFFEERSAAFFALGRIAVNRQPVAILTTSGTAVAELLPAVIEATYSSLPLIVVSSDRPKSYRGSGAPQSIEQVGIFSYYTEVAFDLDTDNTHLSFKGLSWKKPIHVNICFDEPLIDSPVEKILVPEKVERARLPEMIPMTMLDDLEGFLKRNRPLVVLGYLPLKAHQTVLNFLRMYRAPVYAEGISGLRGHPDIVEQELMSGENILPILFEKGLCNSILRIGGVPTLRLWRDLEGKMREMPVMSVGYNHYTGLSREVSHFSSIEVLSQAEVSCAPFLRGEVLEIDRQRHSVLMTLAKKYPLAEPSLVHSLSTLIEGQSVYLGNSLPIREWDLMSDYNRRPLRAVGNRGVNGIDGQVSSFFGWSNTKAENWCLIGDLTAMYDLTGPWIVDQLEEMALRIVVINNNGGQIFNRMFKKDIFLNRHDIDFVGWAKMWNWDYQKWNSIPQAPQLARKQMIELVPDAEQTQQFWNEWDQAWKVN